MGLIYLISFIIWPFASLFFAFKKYSIKWSKNILWAFVVFYGYTFVLSNDTMDANRLKSKFEFFEYNYLNITGVINYFFLYNEDGVDILQPIILYLTSLISSDFQVLMGVLALIFGFFYSRNICYLIDKVSPNIKAYNYLLLLLFSVIIGFWQINGFRFWTSAHIFFYAVIPFIYENNKKRLWLLPFVLLLHFSFLVPILALLIFLLFKIRLRFYFLFYLISFLFNSINTETVGNIIIKLLPSSFHSKIESYTSNEYAAEIALSESSTSAFLRSISFIIINIFFIIFYYTCLEKLKKNSGLYRLFYFCIIFMTIANFFSLIPSGQRFIFVSALFSISFIILCIEKGLLNYKLNLFMQISSPFIVLAIIGFIRLSFNTLNILTIIGNPMIIFFVDSQKTLFQLF